jgi:hypothetical protein
VLDHELNQLLNRWADQNRLRERELAEMLSNVITEDSAAPWVAFWQQIGRLVRIEQQLAGLTLLSPSNVLAESPAL